MIPALLAKEWKDAVLEYIDTVFRDDSGTSCTSQWNPVPSLADRSGKSHFKSRIHEDVVAVAIAEGLPELLHRFGLPQSKCREIYRFLDRSRFVNAVISIKEPMVLWNLQGRDLHAGEDEEGDSCKGISQFMITRRMENRNTV